MKYPIRIDRMGRGLNLIKCLKDQALSLDDAEHRIGVCILNLAEDNGVIRKGKVTIQKLPFQQDIANMAGTSRETVSRVLKLLEEKGFVTKSGHTLTIPNYVYYKKVFG